MCTKKDFILMIRSKMHISDPEMEKLFTFFFNICLEALLYKGVGAPTKYIVHIPRVPQLSVSLSELGPPTPLSRKRVCTHTPDQSRRALACG
jgi:hypothetical protein